MKCPYCGTKMKGDHLPPTRGRYRAVYEAVAASGPKGIRLADLHKTMPGQRTNTTMRVAIHYTNKVIGRMGQRIVCKRDMDDMGRYFLVSTREM